MNEFDNRYQSRLLRISAHDRNLIRSDESAHDFSVNIASQNSELKKVVACQVINVSIPNVFYNIPDGCNTFTFLNAALATQTVTVPAGQYSVSDFMDALLLLIDANLGDAPGTSTYTLGPNTFKLSMTFSESLTVAGGFENSIAWKLGFGNDSSVTQVGTTVNAPFIINLVGPHSVYVHSPEISAGVLDFDAKNGDVNMIAQVPLTENFGEMCYFSASTSTDIIKYQSLKSFHRISLRLRDVRGSLLDISEHDWTIVIKMWYLI